MTTAIDSMVLIDLFQSEPAWVDRAAAAIDQAIRSGRLIACDIVWAEVSSRFPSAEMLSSAMDELSVEFDPVDQAVASRAGQLWAQFLRAGGTRRNRVVPDFLIGAHALNRADTLLTRDRGFYRRYFKGLRIIEP